MDYVMLFYCFNFNFQWEPIGTCSSDSFIFLLSSYLMAVCASDTFAIRMYEQHDVASIIKTFMEYLHQDQHYELHSSLVIIVQQHIPHVRRLHRYTIYYLRRGSIISLCITHFDKLSDVELLNYSLYNLVVNR